MSIKKMLLVAHGSTVLACVMTFWIVEDFLSFVCNPANGLTRFNSTDVPWHKHWIGVAPTDYWMSLGIATVLLWLSARKRKLHQFIGVNHAAFNAHALLECANPRIHL